MSLPSPRSKASAQTAYVGLEAIDDGAVTLAGGQLRAVLEVRGVDFGLQGPEAREAALAGFAAFLNGLDYPIQILVRVLPMDLERHVALLESRAAEYLQDALAELAWDQAAFLRRLARHRTPLEQRIYVVVPAQRTPVRQGWLAALRRPFGGRRNEPDPAASHDAIARRQLATRCEEVARQLGRCDLAARRLEDAELIDLFVSCWCPEQARLRRVRQTAADYAAPAVRAARALSGVPAAAGAPRERGA